MTTGDSGSSLGAGIDIQKETDEILDIIGEGQLTGYQLKDIFDEGKSLAQIKKKLTNKVIENNLIFKGLAKDKQAEKDEDEEDKEGQKKELPQVNPEQILKQLALSDCIPKLKEHEIADTETFYELTDDKMIELLEIKTEGKKMRFKEKIKEIKEKHEKEIEKKKREQEEKESEALMVGEKFELLQKKSTISF